MLEHVSISAWVFVSYVSLAASAGAIIATSFEGVSLSLRNFLYATSVPGLLAVLCVSNPTPLPIVLSSLGLVAALTILSVVDGTTRTVPDLISVPMIVLGVVHAWVIGLDHLVFGIAALSVIALGIVGHVLIRSQSWIGGGDVLLVAGAMAWFGPAMLPDLAIATSVILVPQLILSVSSTARPASCIPVHTPIDNSVPLAPSLGTAQLLLWFGGPLF